MANNRQKGLLRIAAGIDHEARVDTGVPQAPSSGGFEAASSMAAGFAEIGSKIGRWADQAAQTEGAREGALAGLDPEFRPRQNNTIRGDAYDKAGLDVMGTKLKQGMTGEMDAAYLAHQGDPAMLNQKLDEIHGTYRRRVADVPALVPEFDLTAGAQKLSYMRQAARQQASVIEAEAKAAVQTEAGDGLKRLHQQAFALGLDPAADAVLAKGLESLQAQLARKHVDGTPLVPPAQAAKLIQGAKEEITNARLLGAFDRLPGLEAKEKFIKQLEEDFAGSKGLAKVYDFDGYEKIKRQLETEYRRAANGESVTFRALAGDIEKVERLAEKGFAPSVAEMAEIKGRIAAAKSPELASALERTEKLLDWQKYAASGTPEQLNQWMSAERRRIQEQSTGSGGRSLERLVAVHKGLTAGGSDKSIDALTSPFVGNLTRMLQAMPAELRAAIEINEAHRSFGYQATLRQRYLSGKGGLAAAPGASRHNHGEAVDFSPVGGWQNKTPQYQQALAWMHANAEQYGVVNPPSIRGRDPVHFQMSAGGHEIAGRNDKAGRATGPVYTLNAVDRLERTQKLHETMVRELKEDPIGWADRVGIAKSAALDFSSPDALSHSIGARVATAEQVASYYGQEPKYFRPDEARQLGTVMSQGGASMVTLAERITSADPKRGVKMLGEIAKHAPTAAALGGLQAATGPTATIKDAADGLALQKTDGFRPLISDARKLTEAAIAVESGALAMMPQSAQAARNLAAAVYEVRARRQGKAEFDEELWKKAYREVLGERQIGPDIYGGIARPGWFGSGPASAVIVPADVKQAGFGELIQTIKAEDLIDPFGARPSDDKGRPLAIASIRRAKLVQIGDGRFRLALGDGDDPQYASDGTGKPYVLDLHALRPALKARRPDLYLGGR